MRRLLSCGLGTCVGQRRDALPTLISRYWKGETLLDADSVPTYAYRESCAGSITLLLQIQLD